MKKPTTNALTVVICTYDRYDALEETLVVLLASAGMRAVAPDVLVVDNTPAARRQVLANPDPKKCRVLTCDEVGLSFARNFGIGNSKGNIVAFLDDDALVCDDWCTEIMRAFDENEDVAVIGGRVEPKYQTHTLPAWFDPKLAGYLSCIDWSPRQRRLRTGEWIVGANMAFRRSALQQFGGFDVALGRRGVSSWLSNDETALLERIGMRQVLYVPSVSVQHVIPTERISTKWFRRRVYWQAVSDVVSGLVDVADTTLRQEYGLVISQLEATHRNLNALHFEPHDYTEFALQLRGVYLAAVVLGGGGP